VKKNCNSLSCARSNRKYYIRRCVYFLVGFVLSKETAFRKQDMPNSKIMEILSIVPCERGFHFFTAMGRDTGETATSLDSFAQKLQVIGADSIGFHFSRKDFQNWIQDVIKDEELAEVIDRLKEAQSNEDLRKEVVKTIQTRLTELRKLVVANAPASDGLRLTLS